MSESRTSARHEPIISRFERAWSDGERPRIDDFIPSEDPNSLELLRGLAAADLGLRIEAGEAARVEDYLERYPQLAADRDAVLGLIRVERLGRARQGGALGTEEFQWRFTRYLTPPGATVDQSTAARASARLGALVQGASLETVDEARPTVAHPGEGVAPAPANLPDVSGFELLSVLGRGGMGVVYKARQLSLKRLVALKMISAGGHAGPEELDRFRVEAEAAARLQHPNIVQIHEVGTCAIAGAECPYMALEFVAGGSLARRARNEPPSPDRAAELVATLARAMQHAHERRVIHRDLKPANVLLAEDGRPKITDFGLAKQLEGDSARTASGAVMGTPAYMAPEQAAGRTREIGALSDVYALGAILYELLAGRPPFAGESIMETLEQVRSAEPVPPSRLRPKVPRDLETICLKCLAKEPARRYASASDLAADLDRFRAGESVRARREGLVARQWRLVRRRPRVILAAVGVVGALALAAVLVLHFRDTSRTAVQASDLRQAVIGARERLPDDSAQAVADVERLIDELARVSPEAAAAERALLAQRVDEVIDRRVRGRLDDDEVTAIRGSIDRVAVRSEERARKLRAALDARLRDWLEVFRVEGPQFAERDAVFGPGTEVRDGALEARPTPGAPALLPDLMLTERPSPASAQLRAVFSNPAWESAERVGVALSAARARGGYAFVLSAGRPAAGSRQPRTLGEACRAKEPLFLQILRDGRLMRQQEVGAGDLAGRPLTLWAQRRGDALACQVNGRKPLLQFRDPFSIGAGGAFAVIAPAGGRLSAVVAERLSQPAVPRPLERGDELFDGRQFEPAADFYRKEALGAGEVAQEARYKTAMCLLELGREEDAARLFEEVASSDVPQWPALADCQLWARALEQKGAAGRAQARVVRQRLMARGLPPDQLAPLLPEELRGRLLRAGDQTPLTRLLVRPDEAAVEGLRDAFDALRLLEADRPRVAAVGLNLAKAYRLAGQEDTALALVQDLLHEFPALDSSDMPRQLLEQATWLLRLRGAAPSALAQTGRLLEASGDAAATSDAALAVLPDRARSLAAAGQPALAEQDIDRVLARSAGLAAPPNVVQAWLLKGFLRQRAADMPEALKAWGRGVEAYRASSARAEDDGNLSILLDYWMMAALSGRLDDVEAGKVRRHLLSLLGSDPVTSVPITIMAEKQPAEAYRRMWLTERGRKIAGQIAFREVTYAEAFRLPVLLNVTTTFELMALAGDPTAEQDQLIWDLVRASYEAYVARKLSNAQLTQLVLVFVAARSKASDVKLPEDAALRGPMAYLFGLRYAKQANAKEAEAFFEEALKWAPAKPLAAKELERLKGR
jgi:tetratricopeptide (TPR) repeat protein